MEKISDLGIRFSLKNPYSSFLENLTQKIIPQHIWKDIGSENFPLTIYNLKPVGSGPYKLKEIKQDKTGQNNFFGAGKKPEICRPAPISFANLFSFF